jgi:hypothetical protein
MFFDAFEYWITWVLVLVLVVTSILQVKYLNRALMKFQSKVGWSKHARRSGKADEQEVIPTQFVFFSLAGALPLTSPALSTDAQPSLVPRFCTRSSETFRSPSPSTLPSA